MEAGTAADSEDRIPLWLDCDPGHDDAFAILLAAHHPKINLLGISTVHGNASVSRTTTNAGSVLTAIGRGEVPVYPGAANPICRKAVHAPDIHGESGLDGTELLPEPTCPPVTHQKAMLAMRDSLILQPKGSAWLVATGALTNVGLLFATFPELVLHIGGLSIMGGAIGAGFTQAPLGFVNGEGERVGNISRWAEFNIYCDPEAAQSIFANPLLAPKTVLIPLDLTHQVLATEQVQQRLLEGPLSPSTQPPPTLRRMLYELLTFFAHTYASVFGIIDGPPLHDPLAVAVVLFLHGMEPKLAFDDVGGERWDIEVITDGKHSDAEEERGQLGRTVARKVAQEGNGGVMIPRGVDVEVFWEMVESCIRTAERRIQTS